MLLLVSPQRKGSCDHLMVYLQRFFTTFLEGRNDKEVRVSEWRQHPVVGRLREVSFVSAVKRTMGISPPFAHCHQTQRYRHVLTLFPSCNPGSSCSGLPAPSQGTSLRNTCCQARCT